MKNSDLNRNSVFFPKGGPFGVEMVFFSFIWKFQFSFQKWHYWDQTNTEITKVVNLGDSSHKTEEMQDYFWLLGHKLPPHPPVGVGLKNLLEFISKIGFTVLTEADSLELTFTNEISVRVNHWIKMALH